MGKRIYSQYNRKHMVHTVICEIPEVKLYTIVMSKAKGHSSI